MLGRLTTLILTLVAFSQGSLAASPLCEVVFAPVRTQAAMRRVLAKPSSIVTATEAAQTVFISSEFEKVWRGLESHSANVSPWTSQIEIDSKILKFSLSPKHRSSVPPLRVLITGGVHGNEPVGVVTAIDLINAFSNDPSLIGRAIELTVLPALNFEGLNANRRRLSNGHDLNREFDPSLEHDEKVSAVIAAIETQTFDLALDLHGSNEREQFFVIKQGPDEGLANEAIEVLEPSLRLMSDEGQPTGGVGVSGPKGYEPNRYQLEAPGISTSSNVGTLKSYLASRGTPYSYTVEYPGSIPLAKARAKNLALALAMIRRAALHAGR